MLKIHPRLLVVDDWLYNQERVEEPGNLRSRFCCSFDDGKAQSWCIRNPLEGEELFADDPDMIALLAYAHKERKGVELAPGKH